ncbi:MAG TPA: carboxypeptidase-like regulatory domain-containing protein [Candidatus Acidoferrales bacterium]|nr:carboxypeptidase-like regulatory domain-containing protein [Candidatus Acidoferrales bacterium]
MTPRLRATTFSLAIMLILAAALAAQQDKKKEAQLRTVHGTVMDARQTAVADSIVYLKNTRTEDIKTHIADSAGLYRFSGLDPNVDYEIHAEHNDMTSATHSISSFDSRKDIDIVLKLDKKRPN